MTEYLTVQWQKNLGFQISIEVVEGITQNQIDHHHPNLVLANWWADYSDPDSFLRLAGWQARGGWRTERYEALVEDARRIANQGKRMVIPASGTNPGRGNAY